MKKYVQILSLTILLTAISTSILRAQDEPVQNRTIMKNTITIEAGSYFSIAQLTYDRIIYQNQKTKLAAATGIGYGMEPWVTVHSLNIPVEGSILYGKRHHVEAGLGYTLNFNWYFSSYSNEVSYIGDYSMIQYKIGYRFQQFEEESGFSAKVAVNVLTAFNYNKEGYFFHDIPVMPSMSLGYSF